MLHLVATMALFRDSASLKHNSLIELRDIQVDIRMKLNGDDHVVKITAVLRTNIDVYASEKVTVNPKFISLMQRRETIAL